MTANEVNLPRAGISMGTGILMAICLWGPPVPCGASTPEPETPTADNVLIQVLIYGLAVVENFWHPDEPTLLEHLEIHVPAGGDHVAEIFRGAKNGDRMAWCSVTELEDHVYVWVDMPGEELRQVSGYGSVGSVPLPPEDTRWILLATELTQAARLPGNPDWRVVEFDAGVLENCGFVHDRMGNVCHLGVPPLDESSIYRVASEYVVVRASVPSLDEAKVQLYVGDDLYEFKDPIPLGDRIFWDGKWHDKVIDILIRNSPNGTPVEHPMALMSRRLDTDHAHEYLRDLFRGTIEADWRLRANFCLDIPQPSCHSYFSGRYNAACAESNPAVDVPATSPTQEICPMVGYP